MRHDLTPAERAEALTHETLIHAEQFADPKMRPTTFEKQIAEHEKKLADYRADPYAFDNKGILKNAPEHLRQNIINGRIKALESQISKQREELRKILDLLRE